MVRRRVPNPRCRVPRQQWRNIYRRTWDLLSAVDLDGDDLLIGSTRLKQATPRGSELRACADGSTSCTEDGRPLVWNFNRINFYERLPGFNIADVDKDGTENGADGAPFDPTERTQMVTVLATTKIRMMTMTGSKMT